MAAGLPPLPPGPRTPPNPSNTTLLVWPHHALTILFALIFIGIIAVQGWRTLRGDACNRCGADRGFCPHTRDEYPGGKQ